MRKYIDIIREYQEPAGSTFTHDGVEYDLNKLLPMTKDADVVDIPLENLTWMNQYSPPEPFRIPTADTDVPVLVVPWDGGKLAVVDGRHRLAKAEQLGMPSLPAIYVTDEQLEKCRIDEGLLNAFRPQEMMAQNDEVYSKIAHDFRVEELQHRTNMARDTTGFESKWWEEQASMLMDELARAYKLSIHDLLGALILR